jgi:hypothetical protein
VEGLWGNREVPPPWTVRRGLAGEIWFPPWERAEGEGPSYSFALERMLKLGERADDRDAVPCGFDPVAFTMN